MTRLLLTPRVRHHTTALFPVRAASSSPPECHAMSRWPSDFSGGLNAANPFGEHDFHRDKTRDGSLTIPEGQELTFRYRVVIHSGELDRAAADSWAKQYGEGK